MTIISGIVSDSAAVPDRGAIRFEQVQRFEDGTQQITQYGATARVVDGLLETLAGDPFEMPPSPGDTLVLVTELFAGQTFTFYTRIPDVAEIEYRLLEVVEAGPVGTLPPAWVADVLAARDDAEAAAVSAAADAARAEAAADSVDGPAVTARFVAVENRVTALESTTANHTTQIGTLGNAVSLVQADIVDLEAVDAAQAAQIIQLESDVTSLQGDVSGLDNSQILQDGRLTTLESSDTAQDTALDALGVRVTGTETQNGLQDASISTLSDRVTATETADGVQTADITALGVRVGAAESELVAVDGRLDSVESTNSAQGTSITSLGARVTDVEGTNINQGTTLVSLGNRVTVVEALRNYTGQVRVAYSALTVENNFVANANRIFAISTGGATLAGAPGTLWPYGSGTAYDPDFYSSTIDRLRENNRIGQVHDWRLIGAFSNKSSANTGALTLELFNPDSGFSIAVDLTLASGITDGPWSVTVTTIADNASLAAGRGYQLRVRTSFADNNFSCTISSILRVSRPMENATA